MDILELEKKVDDLVADTNIYGTNYFTIGIAKEVIEAIENKEDNISVERILELFKGAKLFSKCMEKQQRLDEGVLTKNNNKKKSSK